MLDRRNDDPKLFSARMILFIELHRAAEREIVRLGRAAGKDDLAENFLHR